jgi:hypothetical protein
LIVFLDPWWVVVLFINRTRNYLVVGGRITAEKGKAYDSGQEMIVTVMWNPIGFHVVNVLLKG